MKEAIFIVVILLVLLVLTAIRYRKQLIAVLNVWRMLRQINTTRGAQINTSPKSAGQLVNCVKCGTWISESQAIKLGRASFYCSADCVEKSASAA
jgi:hypothetical protein